MEIILEQITPDAEVEIEKACRTCYSSWHRFDPPKSTGELIQKVIKKGHHSVLEHASAIFRVKNVSRVLTHELVRHRLMSYSMESQRYVIYADKKDRKKTKDFNYVIPPSFEGKSISKPEILHYPPEGDENTSVVKQYQSVIKNCYSLYEKILDCGVSPEDARYVLPNATFTEIIISGNLRAWRELLVKRCNPRAHWEIRKMAVTIKDILIEKCPNVFFDFKKGEIIIDDEKKIQNIAL